MYYVMKFLKSLFPLLNVKFIVMDTVSKVSLEMVLLSYTLVDIQSFTGYKPVSSKMCLIVCQQERDQRTQYLHVMANLWKLSNL